jgi:hypothetical protein
MNEYEILNMTIGGMKLKDASAFSFLQWVGEKINGIQAFSANAVELTSLVRTPPMSRNMSDDKKVEIIRRMIALKIPLP